MVMSTCVYAQGGNNYNLSLSICWKTMFILHVTSDSVAALQVQCMTTLRAGSDQGNTSYQMLLHR